MNFIFCVETGKLLHLLRIYRPAMVHTAMTHAASDLNSKDETPESAAQLLAGFSSVRCVGVNQIRQGFIVAFCCCPLLSSRICVSDLHFALYRLMSLQGAKGNSDLFSVERTSVGASVKLPLPRIGFDFMFVRWQWSWSLKTWTVLQTSTPEPESVLWCSVRGKLFWIARWANVTVLHSLD